VKVGDLVRLIGSFEEDDRMCTIIELNNFSEDWHTLLYSGHEIVWPETQIEVISEVGS
jgi:hypothetical protein